MTSTAKRKGDLAEREAAGILSSLTGWPIRPRLQQGRHDDAGDLQGVPDTVVQVRNYSDPNRAERDALAVLDAQRIAGHAIWAVAMIRHRGGRFVVSMTPETFASLLREAVEP